MNRCVVNAQIKDSMPLTKDEIDFIIEKIKEISDDKPEPDWDPSFYFTGSYESDLEQWKKSEKIYKKLIKIRKIGNE